MKRLKPALADSSCHWTVGNLVKEGQLVRLGYDAYFIPDGSIKRKYDPLYSDLSLELMSLLDEAFLHVTFTIFETVLMNDFLNHLIARNTIFIQAEKNSSIYVFRFLQEKGYRNVLYKPDKTDFDLYWTKDGIIVADLISQAPLRTDEPHKIGLEKMLVDMIADKLIFNTYSKAEFADAIEEALHCYHLDKIRLLRYARRRNREREMKQYLDGACM